jgi:hypothetical protein
MYLHLPALLLAVLILSVRQSAPMKLIVKTKLLAVGTWALLVAINALAAKNVLTETALIIIVIMPLYHLPVLLVLRSTRDYSRVSEAVI